MRSSSEPPTGSPAKSSMKKHSLKGGSPNRKVSPAAAATKIPLRRSSASAVSLNSSNR